MNKNEFIKELEKRLEVLEEKEVKSVINKYKKIIDNRVNDGLTEYAAVKELGNINDIARNILIEHKINPDYKSNYKNELKDAKQLFEDWIKDTSKTLSSTAKGVYGSFKKSNKDISIELVFELIIKFIIMLIILAVLTLPFDIVNKLGDRIFDMTFYPASQILSIVWRIFTSVLYFGLAVLIFIAMFKDYVYYNNNNNINNKKETKEEKIKTKELSSNEKTADSKNIVINKKEKTISNNCACDNISKALKTLYMIFMVLVFLIPLWLMEIGLIVGLVMTIYYTYLGVKISGLIIVLIGLIVGAGWLTDIFMQLTFKITKIYFYPVFISLVVICVGGLLFAGNVLSFDYINSAPKSVDFNYYTKIQEFAMPTLDDIHIQGDNVYYKAEPSLQDNVIRVEITYCDSLTTIEAIALDYSEERNKYILSYREKDITDITDMKNIYRIIVSNLKDGSVYNYQKLKDITVSIYANQYTIDKISN